jgi:8-oxo-dGTP diphosphatase
VSDTLVGTQIIRLETIICKIEVIPSLSSTDHDDFIWLAQSDISTLDWAKPDLPAVAKLALSDGFSDLLV